jgi:predicted nucleic acid-binding protein
MIVVIDASAAIEIALNRPKASLFKLPLTKAEAVIAPDLFIAEVTNVFWKYHTFEDLPISLCEGLIENAIALVDDLTNSKNLYAEAFSLACQSNHSVYDMLYLVLARRHNALLMTNDKRLKKLATQNGIKI